MPQRGEAASARGSATTPRSCRVRQGADGASTGWHLHQSLFELATGKGVFVPDAQGTVLSLLASSYLGGSAARTPPPRPRSRRRPSTATSATSRISLAPDRIAWGIDNKGAMIRAVGGVGDPATRLENRSGEPAANPYLYIASQLVSGMDGVDRGLVPPAPTTDPYAAVAEPLPTNLGAAVDALSLDETFRAAFGNVVVDWYATIKRAEFARYLRHVSDWEQREYFGII